MNNSYALDSDSSRWWWPQAAAGAVAAAAISVILVVPATGADGPGEVTRPDPWVGTVDPGMDRPCFLTRAQWNVALDLPHPRCGYSRTVSREQYAGTLRPGLSVLP